MELSDELHILLENDPSPLPQYSLERGEGGGARWAIEPIWILLRRTISYPYQKPDLDTLLGVQFIS
jgi:hypothetical protein